MKVFISWSGDLSRELAETIRDWLPAVLQNVRPFFTPNDIEKGARWNKDISKELEESSIGIFCMTPENLSKPWLMFEAGALSKKLDSSKVCPILFNLDTTDLEGPLVQFQASPYKESEIKKVIKTINNTFNEGKLEETVLDSVFDMWWPKLEENINKVLKKYSEKTEKQSTRTDRDILDEVLELSRLSASNSEPKRRNRVSPRAVDDLLDYLNEILTGVLFDAEKDDIFNSSEGIHKALVHIIKSSNFSRNEIDELLEKTNHLRAYRQSEREDFNE